jgi:hypothetical protein
MQQQQKRKNIEYNFLKICRYLNLVKNQRTILYKFKICMKICYFRWTLFERDTFAWTVSKFSAISWEWWLYLFVLDQFAYMIFIVLAHWNNSLQEDMWLHIILITSQPIFALTP